MKFRSTDGVVESDAGFSVFDLDDDHIRYSAPRLSLTIPVERPVQSVIIVRLSDLATWDPPSAEPLTDSDKCRLAYFLRQAFAFKGIQADFLF